MQRLQKGKLNIEELHRKGDTRGVCQLIRKYVDVNSCGVPLRRIVKKNGEVIGDPARIVEEIGKYIQDLYAPIDSNTGLPIIP